MLRTYFTNDPRRAEKYFITKITEKRGKMQARSLLMLISTLEMVRSQKCTICFYEN